MRIIRRDKEGKPDGVIIVEIDDSLAYGSPAFTMHEKEAAEDFHSEPRTEVQQAQLSFNDMGIKGEAVDKRITISQYKKVERLRIPTTTKTFASRRALDQYIGVNTRPEICATVQLFAPGATNETTADDYKSFKNIFTCLHSTPRNGLT